MTAAGAAGFDLQSLALRTEHDPVQVLWKRGEHLKREANEPNMDDVREAMITHLTERAEPASYLHMHAAGLIALTTSHALKQKGQEFDEALRATQTLMQKALTEDKRFIHYSTGENVDTGLWGLSSERPSSAPPTNGGSAGSERPFGQGESLSDRVEVAIVTFLQKNPNSIYLEIEEDLYPRLPGLLTPSKAMIYSVLYSYAEKDGGAWKLRPEDNASARRNEMNTMAAMIELVGKRLNYSTRKEEKNYLWEENGRVKYAFYVLASALVGRAIAETPYPPEQAIIVIPGGRAALAAYKAQRDPTLAARLKTCRVVKYRLLRTMIEVPVLTRETFEEQVASDPLEKSKSQMMMF